MPQELVFPYGAATSSALFKSTISDFEVEENLGFEPGGEGEHLFLWVEKSGLGTMELIERLAREHALNPSLFGHSGLKDKHALTRQWLSLHLPGKDSPITEPDGDGYRVLRQLRHHKKLRPGTHRSNSFRVCLRQLEVFPDETRQQLESVARQGFANYFGRQRFGRNQDNVHQALAQLGKRRLPRSRKSLYLSSLRSYLFNQILAQRIRLGHWRDPVDGDVFMLRGSHSIFSEQPDDELIARYRQLDISSCASLYGAGRNLMSGDAFEIERQQFERYDEITKCLDRHDSKLQMRPLRVGAESFDYEYDAAAAILRLEFSLPAGSYVTSLLDHFLLLEDVSQGSFDRHRTSPR
jgi:tRNA pseudouridine13 synthase